MILHGMSARTATPSSAAERDHHRSWRRSRDSFCRRGARDVFLLGRDERRPAGPAFPPRLAVVRRVSRRAEGRRTTRRASVPDRCLGEPAVNGLSPGNLNRIVMNGKSWPHTERLTYTVGDTVHIRVINVERRRPPDAPARFLLQRGQPRRRAKRRVVPGTASPHLVNTERLAAGRTISLTWKPTRPGNWLFHCHDNATSSGPGRSTEARLRPTIT